jgi:tetratricopeptide (TPR) repeat protein
MNRQERRRSIRANTARHAEISVAAHTKHQQGNLAAAECLYREALRHKPDEPDNMRLLGEVLTSRGKVMAAAALLQRLTTLQPKNFAAHYSLGNAYRLAGRYESAMACYRAALTLNPGCGGALHGIGACLLSAQRETDALECFRQAVRAEPGWAVAWKDMGMTLATLGNLRLAEAALQRAVAIDPALSDAQRYLVALRRGSAGDDDVAALTSRCNDQTLADSDKAELLFALGNLEDQAGRYDAAFEHYSAANALVRKTQRRAGVAFDKARLQADVDRLIVAFSGEVFSQYTGFGQLSEAPVFIVGMPRAGSTLFEQIAASHSQVFGAGEVFAIGEIASRIGQVPNERWTPGGLLTNASGYIAGLQKLGGPVLRIIDKMPDNIFMLGMIAVLFPMARIIFCERNARDVALSCFFQNFARPLGYDTDLGDCAFRGRELARLSEHWRNVLPLRMIGFSYEALLADPEAQTRRLIEFLGLDWEAQCLKFYETQRPVRTASWSQVREPLYQRSVGRWQHYARHLTTVDF